MQLRLTIAAALLIAGTCAFAEDRRPGELDTHPETPTAQDQSNDPRDVEITRKIRQAVVGNSSLSVAARNVKIVTRQGKVTLRGEVKSTGEKEVIAKAAEAAAGKGKVDDRLEVKSQE